MKLSDLRKGDIVTYANGTKNYVNHPERYEKNYTQNFINFGLDHNFTIMRIQRYRKVLCFYILTTLFKRRYKW